MNHRTANAVKSVISNAIMEAIRLVRAEELETGRYIGFPEAVKDVRELANEVLKSYGRAK